MPTFPKGHSAYLIRVENAKIIAKLAPDTPRMITTTRFEFPNGADLRGIPAVGHGVAGHIAGTQPENAVTR